MPPLAAAASLALASLSVTAVHASSVEDIHALESLINASGTQTVVSLDCPPNHAGYFENDGGPRSRLVICRRNVDLGDADAVWEVLAHEATHVMQSCTGGAALADTRMPRAYRELQTLAPHYAKLVNSAYPSSDQRLEAEAFWMELQTPVRVFELFRAACGARLDPGAARSRPSLLMAVPAAR